MTIVHTFPMPNQTLQPTAWAEVRAGRKFPLAPPGAVAELGALGRSNMPCHIKLMWDYGCWPLWQHDGQIFANTDPASLPLSAPTLIRLRAWAAIPDAKLAEVEYPPDMKWSTDEERAFEKEGRDLWQALQRELGRDYHVVYHSTAEGRVLSPKDEIPA